MYLALASHSTAPEITVSVLQEMAAAIEDQLYNDYAPLHQSVGMPVRVFSDPAAIPDDGRAAPIIVFDAPDQAGALGYHIVTPKGLAYGKAFWKVIKENAGSLKSSGNSLSVTLSHEALEMVGDPYINSWADMPDGLTEESWELCDRTQGDWYVHQGNTVALSNFLGPRAFRDGPGPYDHMQLLVDPWEVRSDPNHLGYAIRRKGGPPGTIFTVGMSRLPQWLQDLKGGPFGRFHARE